MKLKAEQWERITGIEVIDRDGWKDGEDWNREISLDTFIIKCHNSTTNLITGEQVIRNINEFRSKMLESVTSY